MPSHAYETRETPCVDAPSDHSGSEASFVSAQSDNVLSTKSRSGIALTNIPRSSKQKSVISKSTSRLAKPSSPALESLQGKTKNAYRSSKGLSDLISSSPVGSYFAAQPGSPGFEPRSPFNRKPPASRSSHGIGTKSGPPPALSTQRSWQADALRRNRLSPESTAIPPLSTSQGSARDSIETGARSPHVDVDEEPNINDSNISVGSRKRDSRGESVPSMEARRRSTLRLQEDQRGAMSRARNLAYTDTQVGESENRGQDTMEDLFLEQARADSVGDDASDAMSSVERRRSRTNYFHSRQNDSSRPSSSGWPSSSGGHVYGQRALNGHQDGAPRSSYFDHSPPTKSLASLRDEVSRTTPYAASAHPLDQRPRTHHSAMNTKSSFPNSSVQNNTAPSHSADKALGHGRRRSLRESSPVYSRQGYKQSNLSYASGHDIYGISPLAEPANHRRENEAAAQASQGEGTESTVSTTAPSTMWEEIDDLRSRMRKIELTGQLPSSSNAAMSTSFVNRPTTASTTMTTISSSPNRRIRASISPNELTITKIGATDLHPLLHSALAKAKPLVRSHLYRALEDTASDALTLAAMAGSSNALETTGAQPSTAGGAGGIDRQIRKKADSMCRSLTELCIALSEHKSDTEDSTAKSQGDSQDAVPLVQNHHQALRFQESRLPRSTNDEPELRASSRVMSRLEARRTSLLGSSNLASSPRESIQEVTTPTTNVTPTARLDRTSSVIHHRDKNEMGNASNTRPLSRANTEVGHIRPSLQNRISREYTSQHPLPVSAQRSPSVQSSLPTRKSYFPPTQSPITPIVQPGNRRYPDRSTPPSSVDSARLAEARQRRMASLGQSNSGGQTQTTAINGRRG